MEDFFWLHRDTTSLAALNQSIAVVYLDTNLLAYGKETQPWLLKDCANMRDQFYAFDWTADEMMQRAKEQLEKAKGSDWIFVVGHHPLGGSFCGAEGKLDR